MEIEEAYRLIDEKINAPDVSWPNKPRLVVLAEETIEKPWGWVFFYTSQLYLKTIRPEDALAGNAPYIVNRETGVISPTGTAYSIDYYIDEYEKEIFTNDQ